MGKGEHHVYTVRVPLDAANRIPADVNTSQTLLNFMVALSVGDPVAQKFVAHVQPKKKTTLQHYKYAKD